MKITFHILHCTLPYSSIIFEVKNVLFEGIGIGEGQEKKEGKSSNILKRE